MPKERRIFSEEEFENIKGHIEVLLDIRARLISEGILIEDVKKKNQMERQQQQKKENR